MKRIFLFVSLTVVLVVTFSSCGRQTEADNTTADNTPSTVCPETEAIEIDAVGVYNNLNDFFVRNKEIFTKAAKLVYSKKYDDDINICYLMGDRSVVLFGPDDGEGSKQSLYDRVFSKDERDTLEKCFAVMAGFAPKGTGRLFVTNEKSTEKPSEVAFAFETEDMQKFSIIYSRSELDHHKIDNNWYKSYSAPI